MHSKLHRPPQDTEINGNGALHESKLKEWVLFLRNFLKNPLTLSSVVPTSRYGVERVCSKVNGDVRRVIVEYGPGTGVIARRLLQEGKLTHDSKLILIEKTKELAHALKKLEQHDPRVCVFHGDAKQVKSIIRASGEVRADYVLSSIPLSVEALIPPDLRSQIIRDTHDVLKPDGSFIVFLFRYRVKGYLQEVFTEVRTEWEWRNLPPLFVFEAKKSPMDA